MVLRSLQEIPLGKAKLPGSRIGLGTWAIGGGWGPQPETQSVDALETALALGCRLIDTAPLYGNGRAERLVAQVIKSQQLPITVLTKIAPLNYHWAPRPDTPVASVYPIQYIVEQVEGSLRRLQIDCLDCLLFQTWCPGWASDLRWYEAICMLQAQGKIRTFGISVSDHRSSEANDVITAGLVDIIEAPYSIFDQRAAESLFPLAVQHHVSILARSPLASGALAEGWNEGTRFHRRDWRRKVFRDEILQRTVRRVARLQNLVDHSQPLAQFALRFCLSHPAVSSVIVGVQNTEHVLCNFAALRQDPLSQETLDQIARLWQEDFSHHIRTSVGEENEDHKNDPVEA